MENMHEPHHQPNPATGIAGGVLRHLYLEVHTMKHSERFALDQWLSSYPDLSYETIIDMLLSGDDAIVVWQMAEGCNAGDVCDLIRDTRIAFERKVDEMTVFALGNLSEGERL
jgi:hypothetical protein